MSIRSITYKGQIDTIQQLKQILKESSTQLIDNLQNQIPPVLYEFHVQEQSSQSTVYRTHDQIIKFVKVFNKKAKQFKFQSIINFQKIKKPQILSKILQLKQVTQENFFKQFFDIGSNIPHKKISFTLKKQSGGRYTQRKCCLCLKWKKCKAYILNDGVITYDESKRKIKQFLHFGKDFHWEISELMEQKTIFIHSYHRKMTLSTLTYKQFFTFIYCLDKNIKDYQKQQMEYRYNSFAPLRYDNQVQFYVDGAQYFSALALAIQNSLQQVFICGWWISPQFSLIRPCTGKNIDYRFDRLLARTAKRGVKIYIVVYFQSRFLTNDSAYTIQALQALHSNIKVLRHPQIVLPTFWSHHQKLVVIDQSQAFLGGLDICYGRYDTRQHEIIQSTKQMYPGIQYNNCRRADFIEVRNFSRQNVDRTHPRLPWHDVALMAKGKCIKDLSRHFIQYWNYASYQTNFADRYVLIAQSSKNISKKKTGIFNNLIQMANQIKQKIGSEEKRSNRKQIKEMIKNEQMKSPRNFSLQVAFSKLFNSKQQKENSMDPQKKLKSNITHKQSPTSEALYLQGQKRQTIQKQQINIDNINYILSKQDSMKDPIEQQQFQKDYEIKIKNQQLQIQRKMNQIIKIETQIQQEGLQIGKQVQNDYLQEKQEQIQQHSPQTGRNSLQFLANAGRRFTDKIFQRKRPQTYIQKKSQFKQQQSGMPNFTCQVLRSSSTWSLGCKQYQRSICDAYLQMIQNAQKYIYIQNQFFISATHENGVVKNKIMQCIANRVIRAIKNGQNFKVMVLMPLVPGFAGELDDPAASLPRVIMNWQYKTICRGEGSLLSKISAYTKQVGKYIQFYGLRTHGVISDKPITQIIYLHSKLMIVDDRRLICGSANINDRSMQGDRDSELCLLVQSRPQKQIMIDKKAYKVVQKIHQLRVKLWEEHFGITQFKSRNPVNQKVWEQIYDIANKNTIIYRELFGCYPDDEIKNLQDIKRFRKQTVSLDEYYKQYDNIQGNAVIFPLKFLQNQKLTSYHPNAIST